MTAFLSLKSVATRTAVALVATAVFAAPVLAADATKFRYALLTQPGVWDAGIIGAIDQNFFADEGLELELISPATPADGLKLVASGGAELATAHSTDVITSRSKGLPVVSIATTHQKGTTGVLVPATDNIKDLKGLEGKTIGVTGIPFNQVMLEHSLRTAGVDLSKVDIVAVGFVQIPLLLSGRINALGDAITWSEPATYNMQIGKAAADKDTYSYFTFSDYGVPRFYTFGLVTSESALKDNPELYRKFLRAWKKGLEWTIDNQAAAIDGLIKHYPAINKDEALVNLAEISRI